MESSRERFAGIKVIKAFNREELEAENIEKESLRYIQSNMHLIKLRGLIFPMIILLTNFSIAIVLGAGGRNVILNTISPGDFVAFITYLGLLTWPVMAVGFVTNLIQRGKASIDRIDAILNIPLEIEEDENGVNPASIQGDIHMDNVCFSYGKDQNRIPVLDSINVRIKKGELLGIAGPPGSGKTTLANLIPRIYDVESGRITLDSIPIKTLGLARLRQAVAFMPQEPFLFSGSIRENLLFGNPKAGTHAIEKALEMAKLTQTVTSFPDGIDTIIGEKGVMLSGGQKQRIALARALLKDAPVLILDDPISQVDMGTASDIIKTIESFNHKKTIIIISHRFSIFKNADAVIVLKKGKVIESGTHSRLIGHNGYYAAAYEMQVTEEQAGRLEP